MRQAFNSQDNIQRDPSRACIGLPWGLQSTLNLCIELFPSWIGSDQTK